jgi:hypothetical protein
MNAFIYIVFLIIAVQLVMMHAINSTTAQVSPGQVRFGVVRDRFTSLGT